MQDIAILYEADHDLRAQALQVSLINAAVAYPIDARPCVQKGLKTIIFWGHGDEHVLCGKSSDDILRLLKQWKTANPTLDRVEILTCNSAHWRPFVKGEEPKAYWRSQLSHIGKREINKSFNKQLKRGLKYNTSSSMRKIHVFGMPFSGQSGHKMSVSILLWDAESETWALVPAPAVKGNFDVILNYKKQMLIVEMKPPPLIADQPWEWYDSTNQTGPFPARVAKAIQVHAALKSNHQYTTGTKRTDLRPDDGKTFLALDFSDVLTGGIHDLRNALVEID